MENQKTAHSKAEQLAFELYSMVRDLDLPQNTRRIYRPATVRGALSKCLSELIEELRSDPELDILLEIKPVEAPNSDDDDLN